MSAARPSTTTPISATPAARRLRRAVPAAAAPLRRGARHLCAQLHRHRRQDHRRRATNGEASVERSPSKLPPASSTKTSRARRAGADAEPRATEHVARHDRADREAHRQRAPPTRPRGVYFSRVREADYGKLSGRAAGDLKAGARVEGEDDKRHPSDFALWKPSSRASPAGTPAARRAGPAGTSNAPP